jgi:hypothetical protein
MPVIRDRDVEYLESIKIALWQIRFNVQRGGRAGVMDIDDWAQVSLEMLNSILLELKAGQ